MLTLEAQDIIKELERVTGRTDLVRKWPEQNVTMPYLFNRLEQLTSSYHVQSVYEGMSARDFDNGFDPEADGDTWELYLELYPDLTFTQGLEVASSIMTLFNLDDWDYHQSELNGPVSVRVLFEEESLQALDK